MNKIRKPKLGQNFLVDTDAQRRIADALGDLSSRTVIEIGPGHAAITDILAPRAMMQREVADRVAAAPGVRDYGLLSATTQMYAQVDLLFTLPPTAFNPSPDVFSSVVRLHFAPRFTELGVEPKAFDKFLRSAFAQKRKTLKNNLQFAGFPPEVLAARWPASVPVQTRAEQTSLESMAELHRALLT